MSEKSVEQPRLLPRVNRRAEVDVVLELSVKTKFYWLSRIFDYIHEKSLAKKKCVALLYII